MNKVLAVCTLLAVLMTAGLGFAQSFGVFPAMENAPVQSVGPTIASDMAQEGYVPVGQDGTPVPATVRGFDPGNGKDEAVGYVAPLLNAQPPKVQ